MEQPKKCSIFIIGWRAMIDQDDAPEEPAVCLSSSLVSVIVPVYNGAEDLERCLAAIDNSDWSTLECIVVDDASTDPHIIDIAKRHGVRLVRLEQRSGPALARNAGVKKARAKSFSSRTPMCCCTAMRSARR